MFPAAPPLDTARLLLVPLTMVDADEMAVVLGNPRMHEFTGGRPLPADELRERYVRLAVGRSADGTERWCNWIVRSRPGGEAVGCIQATIPAQGGSGHLAWEIGVPWQGRGFASEAAAEVSGWLLAAGVTSFTAHIHPDHAASSRVAARLGLAPTSEVIDGEVVWRRLVSAVG